MVPDSNTVLVLDRVERKVSLRLLTTLRVGGCAEWFMRATSRDELASVALYAQENTWPMTVIGSGSNLLPSDSGVPGLVVVNQASKLSIDESGIIEADAGCAFQDVFLKTAQRGFGGFEFAVGIPGTLGGALVSNAGAYRSQVSAQLTAIEIVYEGQRTWVEPDFLEFSYRDSLLRRHFGIQCVLLAVRFQMEMRNPWKIYEDAREYQRQRIGKQPPQASAGSFFKNVEDVDFANSLSGLPEVLKKAGVVPAGFLIERAGLQGTRHGGVEISKRHANFMINSRNATATEIRQLAGIVKRKVKETFGVLLEEEVLYLGDWSEYLEVWES